MIYTPGKLGKREPKDDKRTLLLGRYATALPAPPETADWGPPSMRLGPMGNLDVGNCALAGRGHAVQTWTASNGSEIIVPDEVIIDDYVRVGKYVRGDVTTDNGVYLIDALNDWRKIGCGGHKIDAYAKIQPHTDMFVRNVRQSIAFFGGCYLGLWLPKSAQVQDRWHVTLGGTEGDSKKSSWGGHCVWAYAYDAKGVWCITWGFRLFMSWTFLRTYCDEAYACASRDWADANGAPTGALIDTLVKDVKELAA